MDDSSDSETICSLSGRSSPSPSPSDGFGLLGKILTDIGCGEDVLNNFKEQEIDDALLLIINTDSSIDWMPVSDCLPNIAGIRIKFRMAIHALQVKIYPMV